MNKREARHKMYQELQMIFQDPYSSLDPRKSVWRAHRRAHADQRHVQPR